MLELPTTSIGLRPLVEARLPEAGVASPVTAVLLSFRGYDTLLEVAVLVLALLAVLSLGAPSPQRALDAGEIARGLARSLVPLMIVVAGYLLWAGAHAPGGAFQAGAVLGAAGVLLRLSGTAAQPSARSVRPTALLGLTVFLAIAGAAVAGGGHMLQYPPNLAGSLILAIEAAIAISTGAILASLYDLAAPPSGAGTRREVPPR